MSTPLIQVFPTPQSLVKDAAQKIVERAKTTIAQEGKFMLFLSGGSTPRDLYQLLASDEFRNQIDWANLEIFFCDERCVPPDDPLSNYQMARQSFLDHVPIPADQIHRMRGEIDPEEAAIEYGLLLKKKFGDGGPDLLLLGMGDDGHTASLFPYTDVLNETHHRCAAVHVPHSYIPAGTSWRITITYPFIRRASTTMILVTGKSKAARVKEVFEGDVDVDRLPIQGITSNGELFWMLDSAAAEM